MKNIPKEIYLNFGFDKEEVDSNADFNDMTDVCWSDGKQNTADVKYVRKKLKDLNEHNAQASSLQWAMLDDSPVLNGIACPQCGEEMFDSSPMTTLTSMPAQKNVHCSKCDYVGYRIA